MLKLNNMAVLACMLLFIVACTTTHNKEEKEEQLEIKMGLWLLEFKIGEEVLPFNFELIERNGIYQMDILNAKERIKVNNVRCVADSFIAEMPGFESRLVGKFINDSVMEGYWQNYSKGNYEIPFVAQHNIFKRFRKFKEKAIDNITGKWEVNFSPNTEDVYPALGIFEQNNDIVIGTFVTETGDYRHLQGQLNGNKLNLSCFDGAHAFLFTATVKGDSILNGMFYSGHKYSEPWHGKRNAKFTLTDPNALTYLKPGYDKLEFAFPDLDSNMVSLQDDTYKGKVTIVQIMGSWCPNCMDETRFYSMLYKKYHTMGLEIVALAFERTDDFNRSVAAVEKFKKANGAEYTFLIAGKINKKEAAKKLPMLNHIMSYPTSIFIDKKGNIQKIHTGFYGPGTGQLFINYAKEVDELITKMIKE